MGFRWREFQGNNVSNHIKWFDFIYVLYEIHFQSLKESKRENGFILKTTHYWFFWGGGGGEGGGGRSVIQPFPLILLLIGK